jgi:hypothetical protein
VPPPVSFVPLSHSVAACCGSFCIFVLSAVTSSVCQFQHFGEVPARAIKGGCLID